MGYTSPKKRKNATPPEPPKHSPTSCNAICHKFPAVLLDISSVDGYPCSTSSRCRRQSHHFYLLQLFPEKGKGPFFAHIDPKGTQDDDRTFAEAPEYSFGTVSRLCRRRIAELGSQRRAMTHIKSNFDCFPKKGKAHFSPILTPKVPKTTTVPSPKLQNTRSRLYRGYAAEGSPS